MSKTKAKIKEFKVAFLKPDSPDKASSKLKDEMEKEVAATLKSKTNKNLHKSEISVRFSALRTAQKQYADNLLSYKLTKHWDEPAEFDVWKDSCESTMTPAEFASAVGKILGNAPTDDFVKATWERFATNDSVLKVLYEKAPQVTTALALEEVANGRGPRFRPNVLPELAAAGVRELVNKKQIDQIPPTWRTVLSPADALAIAQQDPDGFLRVFLNGAQPKAKWDLLKDPKLRATLANAAGWNELQRSTPVLGFLDAVKTKVDNRDQQQQPDEEKATVEAVFDELLSDNCSIAMTYYTNQFTAPLDIMGNPRDKVPEIVQKAKTSSPIPPEKTPDMPAAQCDVLVSTLQTVIQGALGDGTELEAKHFVLHSMVLTVPLSKLPGGLLKNTFPGNVYNDQDQLTGQVLFTGNPDGDDPAAHTVLLVGGVKYDAVLGTKGDQVDQSVADEFGPWVKKKKVDQSGDIKVSQSKNGTGLWAVESHLTAPANKCGFHAAYYVTDTPERYAAMDV
jgi:hypothetical protein